jgi:hypothetical protein
VDLASHCRHRQARGVPPWAWLGWTSSFGAPMPASYHLHEFACRPYQIKPMERCTSTCLPGSRSVAPACAQQQLDHAVPAPRWHAPLGQPLPPPPPAPNCAALTAPSEMGSETQTCCCLCLHCSQSMENRHDLHHQMRLQFGVDTTLCCAVSLPL